MAEPEAALAAQSSRAKAQAADLEEELDPLEVELDPTGTDPAEDDLTVRVLPNQVDEFACTVCWLVHHRSQRAPSSTMMCRDCAA